MNVSAMTALNRNLNPETIVEMYNRTIRELRAIAKKRDLRVYHMLRKAELVVLLETPVRSPRRPGQKKSLGKVIYCFPDLRKWMPLSSERWRIVDRLSKSKSMNGITG